MVEAQPDVLVSIDLGTTYTGVAWMTPRTPIQVINDWPGSGDRGERKVPTRLIYNRDGTLSSWGFLCQDDDEIGGGKIRREFFKMFIDEEMLRSAQQRGVTTAPRDTMEAERFLKDYLQNLYLHIKESIELQLGKRQHGGWRSMAVTFLFSVPTTWTNMSLINTFKSIVRRAGFGLDGPTHNAIIDLTEAEAASVATLKTSALGFQVNNLFLTVDAGGGTTDLALMRVTSTSSTRPTMSQAAAVRGIGTGSSLIDREFAALVSARLAANPDVEGRLPPNLAEMMSRSHYFKIIKHKFGERVYMQETFKITMEGVASDFNHPGLRIEHGKMLFTKAEIQSLFDTQIARIMDHIYEQLDWMKNTGMRDQVEYMILAGGLGSSAYVRQTIQEHLTTCNHPNARDVAIIPCQEPQLVVVRGLLLDQQQKMEFGNQAVLATRIARASYGVIVQELYDPTTHFNEDLRQDAFNRKDKWAINQIQWLIQKGDVVNPNVPLCKSYNIRLNADDATRCWDAEIVTSDHEPYHLPRSMKQPGATKLCSVKSNLTGIQQDRMIMKRKQRSWFRKGPPWYLLQFEVRVIIAPADLRFELWFDGCRFSGNHEPIAVTWQ